MTAVVVIEGVVIVLLLVLVAGLLKSHAEILRRLESLSGSALAPRDREHGPNTTGLGRAPSDEIVGVDQTGATTAISLTHGKGDTLLAFLSTGCASCRVFWSELSANPASQGDTSRPVIVTKGPSSESPGKVRELAPDGVSVIMSDEAWDTFRVPLTPYFMLVGGNGAVLGEGSATDTDHLKSLLEQSALDADPTRLSTRERERRTDESLDRSGVRPGDTSLYDDPLR